MSKNGHMGKTVHTDQHQPETVFFLKNVIEGSKRTTKTDHEITAVFS